jgi:hypothetical protein
MSNIGTLPIKLVPVEDRPAQLMLMKVSTPLKKGERYGERPEDIYQYQDAPIPGGAAKG